MADKNFSGIKVELNDGIDENAVEGMDAEEIEKLIQMRNALLAQLEGGGEEILGGGGGQPESTQNSEIQPESSQNSQLSNNSQNSTTDDTTEMDSSSQNMTLSQPNSWAFGTPQTLRDESFATDIDLSQSTVFADLDASQSTINCNGKEESEDSISSSSESDEEEDIDYADANGSLPAHRLGDDFDGNEEIDDLLEKPIGEDTPFSKKATKRFKRVLEYRGTDHFDVLPDGWVEVTHASGMPVYLHKPSRCCTFARPYFLGPTSVRNHKVPESAIPCYFQKKITQDRIQEESTSTLANEPETNGDKCPRNRIAERLGAPLVKVRTADDISRSQLNPDDLHEYAKKCFKFKNICVYRFGKWTEARKFYRNKKRLAFGAHDSPQKKATGDFRPGLPCGVKLITAPALDGNSKPQQQGFYLNPQGKTSVSVLHEYVQKMLKCTVRYFYNETRSSATPYHCIVKLVLNNTSGGAMSTTRDTVKQKLQFIQQSNQQQPLQQDEPVCTEALSKVDSETTDDNGEFITLGEGFGNSKKNAKLMAAKNAISDLIPDIDFDLDGIAVPNGSRLDESSLIATDCDSTLNTSVGTPANDDAFKIFDMLRITDTRIPELCARAGQPTPYLILQEYLKRYAAFGDTAVKLHTTRVRHQRHEFELRVGKHNVRVICANKREGKQKAAQAMLRKLHPNLETWGAIIRLYGYEAQQKLRDARKSKESVIKLQGEGKTPDGQTNSSAFQPNALILEKLRTEMHKLSEGAARRKVPDLPPNTNNTPRKRPAEDGPESPEAKLDLRPDKIDHVEHPIMSDEQLRELSKKLAIKLPESCNPYVDL